MTKIECVVIKRNGDQVEFNSEKILSVLKKVLNCGDFLSAPDDLDDVITDIKDNIRSRTQITTTEINDVVEQSLMKNGFFDEAKTFILYREQNKFIKTVSVDKDAMSEYVFMSRYSRYLPRRHRRETWNEAVDRVMDMHIKRYPDISKDIAWAFQQVRDMRVLPSMRSMQFGGWPIEDKNSRLYNCTYSVADRTEFFSETMYLLLTGCGVGFSVEFENINKLPDLIKPSMTEIVFHKIGDSIEGWAEAIKALINSYVDGTTIEFEYRKIRNQGEKIRSGGKAPGHIPLRRSIEKCRAILDGAVERKSKRLKPIEVYDIIMHISDAVLSGGVRRSATICLFSPEDDEMMNAKTGTWFEDNPQRGRSNNSVKLIRENTSREQFQRIFDKQKEFGEPGFYFAGDLQHGTNPCLTGDTIVATDQGDVRIDTLCDGIISGRDFNVITYNIETKEREFEQIQAAALTRTNANVIELEIEDGRSIKLTPDHKVYTKTRGYVEAAKLTTDDELEDLSLLDFYKEITNK